MSKFSDDFKKEACEWYSDLSMNEQDAYRLSHPFYSKMGKDFFLASKSSTYELYTFVKESFKTKKELTEEIFEQAAENIIYDVNRGIHKDVVDTDLDDEISEFQIEFEEDYNLFKDGKIYFDVVCNVRLKLEKLEQDGIYHLLFKLVD